MTNPRRYSPDLSYGSSGDAPAPTMEEDPQGDWIRVDDTTFTLEPAEGTHGALVNCFTGEIKYIVVTKVFFVDGKPDRVWGFEQHSPQKSYKFKMDEEPFTLTLAWSSPKFYEKMNPNITVKR